jgi:hypothetical protein
MRKDLVIIPDDEPGVLARLGETLGAAGVNIEAISAFTGQGKGIVHLLVDDADRGLGRPAGDQVGRQGRPTGRGGPAPDEPGQLGIACRKLADAEVNIEQAYIAGGEQARRRHR